MDSITAVEMRPPRALTAVVVACFAAVTSDPRGAATPSEASAAVALARLPSRPLAFERNDGQTDARVRFVALGAGGAVFVTDEGMTIAPRGRDRAPLRLTFDGAEASRVDGEARLPGVANHLRGRDPARWQTSVPLFARAVCREPWRGIDVVFRGTDGRVEYDFEVAPGADPESISLRFDGADSVAVDGSGDLVVATGGAEFRHLRPRVFEDGREIAGAFEVRDGARVGFRVPGRDASRPLVIDPVIAYASYLGGSDSESPFDVAVDASGNSYVTGAVASVDFPVAHELPGAPGAGSLDAFVTVFNASGAELLYSTYLGGSGADIGWGVRVDASGVYVAGSTTSPDFPAVGAYQSALAGGIDEGDAFLVKLAPSGGSVIFSTLLGGSADDGCRALAIDPAGDAFLGGFTSSIDFPTTPGATQRVLRGSRDGWAAKIGATGATLGWSTYFGGTSAPDVIEDVAIDAAGNLFAAGYTASDDLPTTGTVQRFNAGGLDGFVAKLAPDGAIAACTYLGGFANDGCRRVALDATGRPCVGGFTLSENFPRLNDVQGGFDGGTGTGDGFVAQLDASLATLVFSSYLGGREDDDVQGLAVAPDGSVYVTGNTTSPDFPVADAIQPAFGGTRDAFVTKLDPALGAIVWSTYYGRQNYDAGSAIAVDAFGDAYVALVAGAAGLDTLCAAQPRFAGGDQDCYVVKLTDVASAIPARPLALTAAVVSPYRVDLGWADPSRNECSFRVERRLGGGEFVAVASPETNVTTFADPGVSPDSGYTYRVFAVNPFGDSEPSDEATAATPQTLVLAQRAGKLTESAGRRQDKISVETLIRFTADSADRTADPRAEGCEILLGDEGDPVTIAIPAGDPRWKRDGARFTWTSPRKATPQVRLTFDVGVPSVSIAVTKFDFPTTPAGTIFLSVRCGNDAGHVSRTWTPKKKKPGRFKLP